MTPCQSPHSSVCVVPRCGEPNGLTGRFFDRLLCLLAGLVVIAGSTVLPALAQPLDPGSLIGVWSGRMTAMDDPSLNSKMVLTIKRVEGGYVFGLREVYPMHGPVVSRSFRGTLEGNELRIGAWTLTVFPGRMTGHGRGGSGKAAARGGIDVELTKE